MGGISIGDSLLDYFNEKQISIRAQSTAFKKKKFRLYEFNKHPKFKFSNYDIIQVYIKKNDNSYIIYSLRGLVAPIKFDECKIKQNMIISEIDTLFVNDKNITKGRFNYEPHDVDPKSKLKMLEYYFKSGSSITIMCADYQTIHWDDELALSIEDKEFVNFLNNEAY